MEPDPVGYRGAAIGSGRHGMLQVLEVSNVSLHNDVTAWRTWRDFESRQWPGNAKRSQMLQGRGAAVWAFETDQVCGWHPKDAQPGGKAKVVCDAHQ